MRRFFFLIAGWSAVGLGMIGIILPVLPTTPFMILAAFLFAKGSPKAREWLVTHRHFGSHIREWEENGAISRRAKTAAISAMAAVFMLSVLMDLRASLLLVQAVCLFCAALFILSRPTAH